jgi:hypothetical protein
MTAPIGAAGATPAPVPAPAAEPTHGCIRCGRRVPIDVALCEDCNPLGLKQPAATQVHAIAVGGIVAFVIFLAIIGRVALGGIGPFTGAISAVSAVSGGLQVTVSVTNKGTRNAATTCRVMGADREVGGPSQVLQTPNVPAGATVEFSSDVAVFGAQVQDLAVDCQSP